MAAQLFERDHLGAQPHRFAEDWNLGVLLLDLAAELLAGRLARSIAAMVARGAGAVVNVSTVAAAAPARDSGIYGATKAGLELLTRVWADEFGRSGVRVNAIEAGPTETPGTTVTPGLTDRFAATTTLGRVAAPDEIANAVVFLSSPAASYVNGAVLQVTGGQLAIAA